MRPERFALLRACALGLVLAGASAATSGCVIIVDGHGDHAWADDWGSTHKETRNSTVPHVTGKPVEVNSRNGSISVIRDSSINEVKIEARIQSKSQERLSAAVVEATRDAEGGLHVSLKWPENKWERNEGCSFEIRLPDATGVYAKSSNGAITFEGIDGDAVADTSNGSIRVEKQGGSLRADTSNGKVIAKSITGNVFADTSNGSVTLEDIAGAVEADTSNGKVSVTLAPTSPGPVTIDTSNGSVEVICGAAFAGEVSMETSNGAITLTDNEGKVHKGKGRLTASVGSGGAKSLVSTSNGSIKFTVNTGATH
ncbi:MAG: DUF4097 domain-containing protein [Phycisphaerales bacterium]